MSWLSEFGAEYQVPEEILRSGVPDVSWHNDASPSFGYGNWLTDSPDEIATRLWVEHPDPNRREINGGRFIVITRDETLPPPEADQVKYEGGDASLALRTLLDEALRLGLLPQGKRAARLAGGVHPGLQVTGPPVHPGHRDPDPAAVNWGLRYRPEPPGTAEREAHRVIAEAEAKGFVREPTAGGAEAYESHLLADAEEAREYLASQGG